MTNKASILPPTDVDQGREDSFISRWSRRKTALRHGEPTDSLAPIDQPSGTAAEQDPGTRIDPRTGKRYEELTDADMPPLDILDETSDLSVFLARNISPNLRVQALTKVFRSPKYNQICLCAEYADDYTSFEPLGNIIPHDMKSAIVREADKLRHRLLELGEEITREEAEARVLRETRSEVASAGDPDQGVT